MDAYSPNFRGTLEGWFLGRHLHASPYLPPELVLSAQGYLHIGFKPHSRITTSPITEISGRFIRTQTGSIYRLGEPSDAYMAFMQEYYGPDWTFDPDNPITVRDLEP